VGYLYYIKVAENLDFRNPGKLCFSATLGIIYNKNNNNFLNNICNYNFIMNKEVSNIKILVVFLFLLIVISLVNAQKCEKFIGSKCAELEWERAEAKSGDVAEIIISPSNPDIMYVGFEVNVHSLYKSTDAGKSWKRTSSSKSFDVEYVAQNPDIVYASTNDGVLKSKDFGDTWYKVNYKLPAGDGQGIGVSIDGNVIYAAIKDEGVYVARLVDVRPMNQYLFSAEKALNLQWDLVGFQMIFTLLKSLQES